MSLLCLSQVNIAILICRDQIQCYMSFASLRLQRMGWGSVCLHTDKASPQMGYMESNIFQLGWLLGSTEDPRTGPSSAQSSCPGKLGKKQCGGPEDRSILQKQ